LITLSEKSIVMGVLGALLVVAVVAVIIIGIVYWFLYGRRGAR
jgi:hypothetical protein